MAIMIVASLHDLDWQRLAIQAEFEPGEMAAICQVSLRQLERRFARKFHQTPKAWLRALRCQMAVELIAQGQSNKEVAAELHFGSPSHFCHDFRKEHAESPRKTVKRILCKDVVDGQQMSRLGNTSSLNNQGL